MKKILSIVVLILACGALCAQVRIESNSTADSTGDEIFTVVENDPEFPGGMEALYRYLASNIKYPEQAKAENLQGRVFVSFVIEKDGSVSNIKVLRDIGGGCGEEAIRVVQNMPKWKPGRQRGRRVRTQFQLPIYFNIN